MNEPKIEAVDGIAYTFAEWLAAAKLTLDTCDPSRMRAAWRAGEDPENYRKAFERNSWEVELDGQSIARCNYATDLTTALDRAEQLAIERGRKVILHWGTEHLDVEAKS